MMSIATQLRTPLLSVLLLLCAFNVQALTEPSLKATAKQKSATKEIIKTLNKRHFADISINDELSVRFLENYLKQLDPNKSFFIAADISEFYKKKHALDDEIKRGDNATGFYIYSRFRQRLTNRLNQVIEQLNNTQKTFDFTIDEEFVIDSENLTWPKDKKEADERWRKRIKSYFLNQKLAGEEPEKSRNQLIKRYQNQIDRIVKNNAEDIYELYINAFTVLYDPHTNYFSPRTSENFSINMSLSLEGIGAVLQTEDEHTKVVRLVTAGPADKQGSLKPADRIIGVAQGDNGEMVSVVGWRLDEVVDLIRGPKDSIVLLEVIPSNAADTSATTIRIKRDKVKLEDQAAQKAILTIDNDGQPFKVGIIDIPTFYLDFEAYRKRDPNYRSTSRDVNRLLNELKQEGVDGIVIDLRNNGGGSLYEATTVTDLFIDKGPVVQIGKDDEKSSNYSQNNARYRGPLVVLINRLSASASEIFAGAIQDYRRGIIVGSQSFGKGTVQTLTPLKSQGELKITESKFYRVSGESTQHRGVIPDITMPELINTEDVGESSYDTALAWSQTAPVKHGRYFAFGTLLKPLKEQHDARITKDADFIYLNEQKSLLEQVTNRKTVSLQEKKRLQQKQLLEQQSLAIENKKRKSKGLELFSDYEKLKENNEKETEKEAANSGTTVIDVDNDAILKEAGYILKDFIELLSKQNGKVAQTHN